MVTVDRDLLRSLSQLATTLSRSRTALEHATVVGREVRDGADESGSITVVIDDEGAATDIRVAAGWRSRLAPAQVGPAVVAADSAAATRRATATMRALAESSDEDSSVSRQDGGSPWPGWLVPVPTPEPGHVRSLADLSAAVWAALDDLDHVTAPAPPAQGCGARGAVRITMEQGRITGCEVNQAWLTHQDDVTLAHALREAVCGAATARLAARAPLIEYQQRLQQLVADATVALAHPQPGGSR
jgi:hypothetical protein